MPALVASKPALIFLETFGSSFNTSSFVNHVVFTLFSLALFWSSFNVITSSSLIAKVMEPIR